jgi:hypothetical protein
MREISLQRRMDIDVFLLASRRSGTPTAGSDEAKRAYLMPLMHSTNCTPTQYKPALREACDWETLSLVRLDTMVLCWYPGSTVEIDDGGMWEHICSPCSST